ncbi:nucleotide exchange factor GrpE [Candidatus Parcubacteria bacterium]|nr:nucleotide exchange factor GrpE [Candidatus Parcubacteria bacterium]
MKKEKKQDKLKECEKQRDEYLAGWQRAKADFMNYKKEESARINEILKYKQEEMVLNDLLILDNFALAEKIMPEDLKKDPNVDGLLKIKIQLKNYLKSQGLEEITALNSQFDPNFCEVIEEVKAEEESGTVVEEVQKGYILDGKVIRPAKVKVSI